MLAQIFGWFMIILTYGITEFTPKIRENLVETG